MLPSPRRVGWPQIAPADEKIPQDPSRPELGVSNAAGGPYLDHDSIRKILQVAADHPGQTCAVNVQGKSSQRPLHTAAREGPEALRQALELHGAHPDALNAIDAEGMTPLHMACICGNLETAAVLLSLEGTLINAINISGQTPLHLAVSHGHEDTVRMLLQHGADSSLLDYRGRKTADLVGNAVRPSIVDTLSAGR